MCRGVSFGGQENGLIFAAVKLVYHSVKTGGRGIRLEVYICGTSVGILT